MVEALDSAPNNNTGRGDAPSPSNDRNAGRSYNPDTDRFDETNASRNEHALQQESYNREMRRQAFYCALSAPAAAKDIPPSAKDVPTSAGRDNTNLRPFDPRRDTIDNIRRDFANRSPGVAHVFDQHLRNALDNAGRVSDAQRRQVLTAFTEILNGRGPVAQENRAQLAISLAAALGSPKIYNNQGDHGTCGIHGPLTVEAQIHPGSYAGMIASAANRGGAYVGGLTNIGNNWVTLHNNNFTPDNIARRPWNNNFFGNGNNRSYSGQIAEALVGQRMGNMLDAVQRVPGHHIYHAAHLNQLEGPHGEPGQQRTYDGMFYHPPGNGRGAFVGSATPIPYSALLAKDITGRKAIMHPDELNRLSRVLQQQYQVNLRTDPRLRGLTADLFASAVDTYRNEGELRNLLRDGPRSIHVRASHIGMTPPDDRPTLTDHAMSASINSNGQMEGNNNSGANLRGNNAPVGFAALDRAMNPNSGRQQMPFGPQQPPFMPRQNQFMPRPIMQGSNPFMPGPIMQGQNQFMPRSIMQGSVPFMSESIMQGQNQFMPELIMEGSNPFVPGSIIQGQNVFMPRSIMQGSNPFMPGPIMQGQNQFMPELIMEGSNPFVPGSIIQGQNVFMPRSIMQGSNPFMSESIMQGSNPFMSESIMQGSNSCAPFVPRFYSSQQNLSSPFISGSFIPQQNLCSPCVPGSFVSQNLGGPFIPGSFRPQQNPCMPAPCNPGNF